jgi:hypothetical protein
MCGDWSDVQTAWVARERGKENSYEGNRRENAFRWSKRIKSMYLQFI